jgi:hypothetical protein
MLCALACLTFGLGCCNHLLNDVFTEKNTFVLYPLDGLFNGGNNTLLMQHDEHPQGTCDLKTI